jgi:hypothetical protein
MANNRMFLVYRPTGDCVSLGKRIGFGWSNDNVRNIKEKINRLFELAELAAVDGNSSQDDFAIALESGENQPHVIDKWGYLEGDIGGVCKINIGPEVPYGTHEDI